MTVLTNSGLPVLGALVLLFAAPIVLDTIHRRKQRVWDRREAFARHLESVRRVTG